MYECQSGLMAAPAKRWFVRSNRTSYSSIVNLNNSCVRDLITTCECVAGILQNPEMEECSPNAA